jgi:predicted amidohydrolase
MSTIRIAVASTPLTATLGEAVPAAVAAVAEAGRMGARIVCLPETGLPGHRSQARPVPDVSGGELDDALDEVAEAARRAGVVTIVGADGARVGVQAKTQIDPSEEPHYVPGSGRRLFTAAGLTFGIGICHEAFRYPEISRSLVLGGAQVVFVPHYVTTDDGLLPSRWCDASNPYNEKALLCRALENTVFVAASNVAAADQGLATCIIGPDGSLVASLEYGSVGVTAADIDVDRASRLSRCAGRRSATSGSPMRRATSWSPIERAGRPELDRRLPDQVRTAKGRTPYTLPCLSARSSSSVVVRTSYVASSTSSAEGR